MRTLLFCVLAIACTTALGASAASATTIVSLTGSGTLQIDTTGDLYFDTAGLSLDSATLFAQSTIQVGGPAFTLPATPDAVAIYTNVTNATVLSFADDVYFDVLQFSGSIDFRAANLIVTGELAARDVIDLGTATVVPPPGPGGCSLPGTTGLTICTPVIRPPPGGPGPVVSAVPEPGAALLFAAGAAVFGGAVRRRA